MIDKIVCRNPWCKAPFDHVVNENETPPNQCPKCISFDNDLSGGVSWSTKNYEGDRFDGMAHPININVKKYTDNKKW